MENSKLNDNLFKFVKVKPKPSSLTNETTEKKLFWKRFFEKKSNIFSLVFFLIIVFGIIFALFFIKYSPTKPISNFSYTNNLPSQYSQIVKRTFEKGAELDFIREIARLEKIRANYLGQAPIFEILYDSAFDSGGELTTTTDIVILYYNPYDLIKAININNNLNITTSKFILGTNNFGVDIYSRIFSSIIFTILIIFAALVINIFVGFSLAALTTLNENKWYAKIIDSISSIIHSLPEIIWIFLLCIFMGTNWWALLLSFVLISWTSFYEVSKNEIKELSNSEFIIALNSIGLSKIQITYKHLFNLILPSHLVLLSDRFSINMLIVSSLVFLELIVSSNNLNIGTILKEAISMTKTNVSYIVIFASIVILFTLSLKLFSVSLSITYNPQIK